MQVLYYSRNSVHVRALINIFITNEYHYMVVVVFFNQHSNTVAM